MTSKLVVGPISKGLKTNVLPFNIDNDSFPTLINAYQWRGRLKRKRGTVLLVRLQRFLGTTNGAGNATITISPTPIATGVSSFQIGTDIFTDPGGASPVTLITNSAGSGTLNRTTGVLTITGSQANTSVVYFPSLPVMGLEDFFPNPTANIGTVAFDTKYSYIITNALPTVAYDVSFFKNPAADAVNLPGYIPKTTPTSVNWNGQDYQQFWTTNYQGALWATNGVTVPFVTTNVGMQFNFVTNINIIANGPPAIAKFTIPSHGLVQGDFLFFNEFNPAVITGINFQTGYVITVNDVNNVTVEFPQATIGGPGGATAAGIAQYLTSNAANPSLDNIRIFDGDPTTGTGTNPPVFAQGKGWVNFMPPISQSNFSIANLTPAQYYLVGARMILPFKDRIVFFGPIVQSSGGSPVYLQDTILYSQNGTPYYTASFTNKPNAAVDNPTNPTIQFSPILTPSNGLSGVETATPAAFFSDQTGFGGFLTLGISQPIVTAGGNEDVLILGLNTFKARMVYTGNDVVPFNVFLINSELGDASTFSLIVFDQSVMTFGNRGYLVTSQTQAQRVDLEILDQVFEVNLLNNGNERVCVIRNFQDEWCYFTYPSNEENASNTKFPNQTLMYNYREQTWSILNESFTTYGNWRFRTGLTWALVGSIYPTWIDWDVAWNEGISTTLQPQIIAGNQQGFVFLRDQGTGEQNSLTIQNFSSGTVTSPNHSLNLGDYIVISGVLGTTGLNNNIFSVGTIIDSNNFTLNPVPTTTGSYQGGGLIERMYVPFIQSKQFPVSWGLARKTIIGAQKYLLTKTNNGQIQLLIFLSQNDESAYNQGPIVPAVGSINNSLIYSTTLFTSPEFYIQTCTNIPLGTIGNGVTTTFTFAYFSLFTLENTQIVAGSVFISIGNVATFTDNGTGGFTVTGTGNSVGSSISYTSGVVVLAFTAAPTPQVSTTNFQYFVPDIQNPIAIQQAQIWHRISTALIGDTVQLGFTMSDTQMRDTTFSNQFAEIEIHAFIMDLSPSQDLA